MPDDTGPTQRHVVQEAQGTHCLVELAPRHVPGQQMLLVGANLLWTEQLWRTAKVPGEQGHAQHIGLDGSGRLVAQPQIVDEAAAQRGQRFAFEGHGVSPRWGKRKTPRTSSAYVKKHAISRTAINTRRQSTARGKVANHRGAV